MNTNDAVAVLRDELKRVVRQNEHEMLLTGEECRAIYKVLRDTESATDSAATQQAGQVGVSGFASMRARTLLAHLWRTYDAAGTSMGRSHQAVVLEAAIALLGDPDRGDMALLDKDSGNFINDTRSYLSSMRANYLAAPISEDTAYCERYARGMDDAVDRAIAAMSTNTGEGEG